MNKICKYIIQLFLIFSIIPVAAQQISITAKIDTNSILIGDQIKLKYTVSYPENFKINFPLFTDKLTDKIDIVSQFNADTVINKIKSESKTFVITSFDSGNYVIPAIAVKYQINNDTTVNEILSDSVFLNVNTINVDTTLAIKDIKSPLSAPLTLKELLPYIFSGLGLLAIILLTIYFIKKYNKKKNNESELLKPKIPPYKTALQEFEVLRQKKLWQNDRIKEYHSELTDILRNYFEKQLNIQALEKTTDETLEAFESVINDKILSEKLKNILTLADLVKFAKQLPLPDQHDLSMQNAIEIVKLTSVNKKTDSNTEEIQKPNII